MTSFDYPDSSIWRELRLVSERGDEAENRIEICVGLIAVVRCTKIRFDASETDLEALAETRLQDAILLFREGRASSAYYLAGYAVELALKACVAKAFQPNAIPDKAFVNEIYTHSLEKLLSTAGLSPLFSVDSKTDP